MYRVLWSTCPCECGNIRHHHPRALIHQSLVFSPIDAVPTFSGTYRDFQSHIAVMLRTEFTCDHSGDGTHADQEEMDPEDALWGSVEGMRWHCPSKAKTYRHSGKSSTIRVITNIDNLSKDYRDEHALAPRLMDLDHQGEIIYSPVNSDLSEEVVPQALHRRQYGVDLRVPNKSPTTRCGARCFMPGGENSHVGMAWQHKLLREEVQSMENVNEDGDKGQQEMQSK